jgi:hypothetical protein
MTTRVACAVLLCVLLPFAARAELDCGMLMRTVTRFDGTVRTIEPIRRRGAQVISVDYEKLRYLVSVDVGAVEGENPALATGDMCLFGVHSPARTFGADSVGKTLRLEVEWMECDGVFRRIVGLRTLRPGRVIEDIDSYLEVGRTYRAEALWEDDALGITSHLWIPHHHGIGFDWEDVPEKLRDGTVHPIVFEVLAVRIQQVEEWQWVTIYDVRLVEE